MSKYRRTCCFCGGGNLSGEHIWPDWASDILPRSAGRDYVSLNRVWGGEPTIASVKRKQGAIISDKANVVCVTCNNEWMSRLEEAAKPLVRSMILGRETKLSAANAAVLTRWATMKMMVIDRHRSTEHVFKSSEMRRFRDALVTAQTFDHSIVEVPANLEIALFRCGQGRWTNALGVDRATLSNVAGVRPARSNVGVIVWGLGELLISAVYRDGVRFPLQVEDDSEIELWPLVTAPTWPRERRLTEKEATALEAVLSHMTKWPGARPAYGEQTSYGDLTGPSRWLRTTSFCTDFQKHLPLRSSRRHEKKQGKPKAPQ